MLDLTVKISPQGDGKEDGKDKDKGDEEGKDQKDKKDDADAQDEGTEGQDGKDKEDGQDGDDDEGDGEGPVNDDLEDNYEDKPMGVEVMRRGRETKSFNSGACFGFDWGYRAVSCRIE